MKPCRSNLSSRCGSRSGFTLVEILVVIAIIALLAGVALPAITGAIKKARESAAVQSAHGLATAMFQYSTDNNGVFPGKAGATAGAKSSDVFNGELVPQYVSNTDTLTITGGSQKKYTGSTTTYVIDNTNNSWDMIVRDDNTGLISNDPDTIPVIISTGGDVIGKWGTPGTSAPLTTTITAPANNPFGSDGMAVGYKDVSSSFQASSNNGGSAAKGFNMTSVSFSPQDSKGYIQIQP